MSIHKSLKTNMALSRRRNVLTRVERLEKLAKTGKWREGDSVYGLPKVGTLVVKAGKKKKKEEEKKAAEAEAAATTEAKPAAGAKADDKAKKKK